MAQPKVFVSHSHEDNDFGVNLVDDLRRALGSDDAVWYDARGGLQGGDEWWSKIVHELTTRPVFIVILSPAAMASSWVLTEFTLAFKQWHDQDGKLIIPVLYQPCEPRADMKMLQMVSFIGRAYERALADVVKALSPVGESRHSLSSASSIAHRDAALELTDQILRQHTEVKARPNITPIGAKFGPMSRDKKLVADAQHTISLQNAGEGIASNIWAVLFPSAVYYNQKGMSEGVPPLFGTYWEGRVGVAAPSGWRCDIELDEMRWPLYGNLHIAPQHTLYAPPQPHPEEHTPFYSARLTITYLDATGARLATAFDLDAGRLAQNRDPTWDQILLPAEIVQDLSDLYKEWAAKRQPPRIGE